jgi:hypothetical protein
MDPASPRFRQDLAVSTTEADGVPCVDVSDAQTGASFRFYDFEYQLALQLNGQPLAQVVAWASMTYGVDLTAEGIGEFSGRLSELGFLEAGAASETPLAPSGAMETDSAEDEWMSPQGTKTAQFVPDPAMLAGSQVASPDLTPVAPFDMLPASEAELPADAGPTTEPKEPTLPPVSPQRPAQTAIPIAPPVAVAPSAPTSPVRPAPVAPEPGAPTAPANMTESAKSRWALDLDGALQASDSPAAVTAPPLAPKEVTLPPRPVASATPAGIPERRQPPAPEAVVMSGFSVDAAKRAAARPSGPSLLVLVLLLVLGIAGVTVGYYFWTRQHVAAPQALRVRVLSPKPSAIYRWFSGRGAVTDYETSTVAFASAGRLTDLLPAGTELAAGDIIGKLQGATALETLLAHDRSRVGFYQQMRDSMRAAGNQPELRLAELRLAEKQRLVAETTASLAGFTLAATEPGEVVETLAKIGTPLPAATPVARVKGQLLHGAFDLDADERAVLRGLDFCRVEVVGLGPRAENSPPRRETAASALADSGSLDAQVGPRFVDCRPPAEDAPDGDKVEVALPGDLGLVSGQPLRLARRRYDAVFPVPAGALVGAGDQKSIWIAGRDGRAQPRTITVADLGDEALISEGLQVGEQVIISPPPSLRPGALVVATH